MGLIFSSVAIAQLGGSSFLGWRQMPQQFELDVRTGWAGLRGHGGIFDSRMSHGQKRQCSLNRRRRHFTWWRRRLDLRPLGALVVPGLVFDDRGVGANPTNLSTQGYDAFPPPGDDTLARGVHDGDLACYDNAVLPAR
jgi:hypothetical protein